MTTTPREVSELFADAAQAKRELRKVERQLADWKAKESRQRRVSRRLVLVLAEYVGMHNASRMRLAIEQDEAKGGGQCEK